MVGKNHNTRWAPRKKYKVRRPIDFKELKREVVSSAVEKYLADGGKITTITDEDIGKRDLSFDQIGQNNDITAHDWLT